MKTSRSAEHRDHVVAVLITSPDGIPLVRDRKKPPPLYWKVPGGRGNPGELAEEVGVREVKAETGLALTADDLILCGKRDANLYILSFFVARVPSLRGIKVQGDEGEEVTVFSTQEVLSLADFFLPHRRVFEKIIKSELVGRDSTSERADRSDFS